MINKKNNKLVLTIRLTSILQIIAYAWLLQIAYFAGHTHQYDENYWLGGFLPAGIFAVLGIVNILLVTVLAIKAIKYKKLPDYLTLSLVLLVILLYGFLGPILTYIDRI